MNIFSSIPAKHHNGEEYIASCVESWLKHGNVYSVNHPHELVTLKDRFPNVKFIPTFQTQIGITGKPLVMVDAILNELRFRHAGESMMINSDCHLTDDKEIVKRQFVENKFTYLHRWNYDKNEQESNQYMNGIDAFLFTNTAVLDSVQQTHFCLGQTYFDLWYPYAIQMAGMGIVTSNDKVIFHKNHKEQYSVADWQNMGEYTALLIKKKTHKPAQVSEYLYGFLRKITQKI